MGIYQFLKFFIFNFWLKMFHIFCNNIFDTNCRINMIFMKLEKKWILETVQAAWKKHKSRLNKYNFDAYGNDDTRRLHMLEDVPASRFKKLLKYWNSEKLQRISKTNIENRKKLKNPHSTGKRSFALIQSKLEKGKESSDPLSSKELYVATGKRKLGRSYKCSYEDTTS
ncbi:uncharacterized protein LOC107790112 isoform X2 [Nicotiana tabacum]